MGFQIKHKDAGIYQGSFMGLGFWHPLSGMPEQGYCEFPTREEAEEFIRFLTGIECDQPLDPINLSIEPFDKVESDRLIRQGAMMTHAEKATRSQCKQC